jgi:predicted aspartyl protease
MISTRVFAGAVAAAGLALGAGTAAHSACQLQMAAQLPIVMYGNEPLVEASINGQPVKFLLDTGADKTLLWRGAAEGLGLRVVPMDRVVFYGIGGGEAAKITTVHELKLGPAAARDIRMMVIGPAGAVKTPRYVGLLGADMLLQDDIELDFANGVVRVMKPKGCQGDEVVYWNKPYSVANIIPSNSGLYIEVSLNGKKMEAQMDTGAWRTIVTQRAAAAAGVTPSSEGVTESGKSVGIGAEAVKVYSADFPTLSIGDEKVGNAKLELGQIFEADKEVPLGSHLATQSPIPTPDMLLGADFMKAHRIYIARSQGKVYFSYNGGPIFEVRTKPADKPKPAESAKP